MPHKIVAPSNRIPVAPLDPNSFATFGEVIQNPNTHNGRPSLKTIEANQGTATKWLDITHMKHNYDTIHNENRRQARCSMNMFVCQPRKLRASRIFDVGIMERHPYTPQTFVPMGLDKGERDTAYLVIVAPSLPIAEWNNHWRHSPRKSQTLSEYQDEFFALEMVNKWRLQAAHDERDPAAPRWRAHGPPDMANARAFIARGDQAVTYGAGTWHAPMVVLGEREVEFVVVQFVNGVQEDDVQEVEIAVGDRGRGVEVDVGAGVARPKL